MPLPFSRLGPYELISAIGAGGMGEVYSAMDTKLGRKVALKILPERLASDPAALARFEREAKLLATLSNPGILSIFDFGREGDVVYAVMELLEGRDLRQALKAGELNPRKTMEIGNQVAKGLAAAHEKGIIHRDLKPENIFLTKDSVKILDFGLAKTTALPQQANLETQGVESFLTAEGAILGTVAYMAPEQVRGEATDARTDIFSFGSVLYEMVTGERPFKGATAVETMHAILKVDPPELDTVKVPFLLERVIRRCLEKDAGARFQSARDLAFALDQLGSVGHTSDINIVGLRSTTGSHPLVKGAVVGALLCLIAIAGTLGMGSLHHNSRLKFEALLPVPMHVTSGKFMQDGKGVVFSAIQGDGEEELYLQAPGEPTPRPLGVKNAQVLAVSPFGEIALRWRREDKWVLALLRGPGLSPKVLEEQDVRAACWDSDGKELIVKYWSYENQKSQVLVYRGKEIYRVPWGYGLGEFTLSADKKSICFIEERGDFSVLINIDYSGNIRTQKQVPTSYQEPITAGGQLLVVDRQNNCLLSMDYKGLNAKILIPMVGKTKLLDGLADGSILFKPNEPGAVDCKIWWQKPDQIKPQQLGFFSQFCYPHLARGGTMLAFSDEINSEDEGWLITSGSTTFAPIGNGFIRDLTEEGDRALVFRNLPTGGYSLWVVPTGPGRELEVPGGWVYVNGNFFKDGNRALISALPLGAQHDHHRQSFLLDAQSGQLHPLAFKARGPVNDDGQWAFEEAETPNTALWNRVNLGTGQMIALPETCRDRVPVRWTTSGREIWTIHYTKTLNSNNGLPLELAKVDLASGRILSTQIISGSGLPGGEAFGFTMTRDGRSLAYLERIPATESSLLYRLSGLQ